MILVLLIFLGIAIMTIREAFLFFGIWALWVSLRLLSLRLSYFSCCCLWAVVMGSLKMMKIAKAKIARPMMTTTCCSIIIFGASSMINTRSENRNP